MSTLSRLLLIIGTLLLGCSQPTPVDEIAREASQTSAAPAIDVHDHDWPGWWGPLGNGKSSDVDAAKEWNKTHNVAWHTAIEGRGHSSPCVHGDKIFVTTAEEGAQQRLLVALNRSTGSQEWRAVIHEGTFEKKHRKNSYASATPAVDGHNVFTAFIHDGHLVVTAVDLHGNQKWQTAAGPFKSEHGYGSSPVLYGTMVIVLGDSLDGSFIAALDRDSGDLIWRKPRRVTGSHGSYATPIVAEISGKDQLVVMGTNRVTSYAPVTGDRIWSCDGPSEVTACAVAWHEDLVFASGGYPEKELLAIRADGSDDVTDSHVVWRTSSGVTYVPSPLLHDGKLFVVNDGGIASCLDAATGESLGKSRLDGSFSASPIYAGGHFYVPNESGTTFVVKADPSLEIVAKNDLGDGGFASLAICGGQIFLRTEHNLYCIGARLTASRRRARRVN